MRVIGAGLGGTGTLQAKAALELLGAGPCYHIADDVADRQAHTALWQAVAAGRTIDWSRLFEGYASCVDFPSCAVYADLVDAYPEARVLLTVRDPERAYERVRETIYRLTTTDSPLPADLRSVFAAIVWEGLFAGEFENRERAIDVYRTWPEKVASRVAADRLLVYDVDEGWEPLCRFLGTEVPDLPFPH